MTHWEESTSPIHCRLYKRWPLTSRPTLLVVSTDCATHRNAASNTLVLVEVSWTVLSTKNHAQAQDKAFTWLKGSSYYAPHATMYWKFRNRRVSQSMWADIDRPVCSQNTHTHIPIQLQQYSAFRGRMTQHMNCTETRPMQSDVRPKSIADPTCDLHNIRIGYSTYKLCI